MVDSMRTDDLPKSVYPSGLFRDIQSEYTTIDTDPHFWRVIRFFRPSDYANWFAATAAGPAAYYYWDLQDPIGDLKIGLRTAGIVGFLGGFFIAYQQSSYRFYGIYENEREIQKDRAEFKRAREEGKPHHLGASELAPYLQGAAARHSRFAACKFSTPSLSYRDFFPSLGHCSDKARLGCIALLFTCWALAFGCVSYVAWLPWFNFVHHNQCVNWNLYSDLFKIKEMDC